MYPIVVAKLQRSGNEGHLLHVINDHLDERTLSVLINGECSSERLIGASVPQGSVLSPLLWNAYFNELLQLEPQAIT